MFQSLLMTFSIVLVYLLLAELFLISMKAEIKEGGVFDFKQDIALARYVFGFEKIGPSAGRFASLLLFLLRVSGGLCVVAFFAVVYVANYSPAAQ